MSNLARLCLEEEEEEGREEEEKKRKRGDIETWLEKSTEALIRKSPVHQKLV